MLKKTVYLLSSFSLLSYGAEIQSSSKHALSSLAPQGHWAVRFEGKTKTTDFSYDNSGKKIELGSKYDNVALDKNILPQLSMFGEGASLGITSSSMKIDAEQFELTAGYGLSEDITVGVIVPYRKYQREFKFSVANGNLGINPSFDASLPLSASNSPYLPTSIEGINPMSTADIQNILTSDAYGFGYKELQSTNSSGFADPTVGVLWRAYETSDDSLILGAGYRFGIAKEDDPDNLLNTSIGDGNSGIRLRMEYYKDLTAGFDLYGKVEYGIELEDRVTKRVPKKGEFLAPKSSTERLDRDLGDYRNYDIGVGKSWSDYRGSIAWHRSDKDSDSYHSSKGTDVSVLEADTYSYANQWEASLSWSGLDAWSKGNLALPLIVNLTYRDTYEAKNALDWSEVYLNVTSFF